MQSSGENICVLMKTNKRRNKTANKRQHMDHDLHGVNLDYRMIKTPRRSNYYSGARHFTGNDEDNLLLQGNDHLVMGQEYFANGGDNGNGSEATTPRAAQKQEQDQDSNTSASFSDGWVEIELDLNAPLYHNAPCCNPNFEEVPELPENRTFDFYNADSDSEDMYRW